MPINDGNYKFVIMLVVLVQMFRSLYFFAAAISYNPQFQPENTKKKFQWNLVTSNSLNSNFRIIQTNMQVPSYASL